MTKKEPVTVKIAKITVWGTIIVAIISLLAVLIPVLIQNTQNPVDEKMEYIGRVIDMNSQQPIVGAKVTLDLEGIPLIVYSDSEGLYQFNVAVEAISTGQIRVDADGYQTYIRNIVLSFSARNVEDVRLTPLSSLSVLETPTPVEVNTIIETPTLISIHPPVATIFEDSFIDNQNHWPVTSSYPYIGAGKYNYSVECPVNYSSYFCGTYVQIPYAFPEDFRMEIDLTIQASTDAQVAIGFQVRRNNRNLYYIDYFITDKYYNLRSAYNTKDLEIIPKTQTDLLDNALGAINRLGIEVQGVRFTPIINGNRLPYGEDGNLTGSGDSYLVIFISRGNTAVIQFDNLVVQEVK